MDQTKATEDAMTEKSGWDQWMIFVCGVGTMCWLDLAVRAVQNEWRGFEVFCALCALICFHGAYRRIYRGG